MSIYLIKRGPRPDHHAAPYHPVVICAKKPVARWEAGWTGDRAWVWTHDTHGPHGGWLLERWEGLDIDYGHIGCGCTLPDGTDAGFWHEHNRSLPWDLLTGAVWWDDRRMPRWLVDAGVIYPPDHFSQQHILDNIANLMFGGFRRGEGCSGFGRPAPDFWPKGLTWDAYQEQLEEVSGG